jgi:segregation and condensation protein B
VPEINEIRGVDSGGVIATLLERKLITTSGRKAVIGRPILYKTSKDFLLRFGLKDIHELPSMEEFEKLLAESFQPDLLTSEAASSENAEAAPDSFEAEPASEIEGVPDNVISIKEHLRRASEDEGHQVEEISAAEETSPVEETSPGPKSSLEPESYTETQVHVEGDVRLENELRQHAEAPTGAEHK